jgi:hypothetical protein
MKHFATLSHLADDRGGVSRLEGWGCAVLAHTTTARSWRMFLCLLSFAGLACARVSSKQAPWTEVVAILSDSLLAADPSALRGCGGEFPRGIAPRWTPTPATVDTMYRLLTDSVGGRARSSLGIDTFDAYRIQAFGVELEGARLVAAIGSHRRLLEARGSAPPFPWRRAPLFVCDAGVDQFFAIFDPFSKRVTHLTFGRSF